MKENIFLNNKYMKKKSKDNRHMYLENEKNTKELYDKIYALLSDNFNEELVKENLKIENESINKAIVNLYLGKNELYKFIPKDDKKIMYCKVNFINETENQEDIIEDNCSLDEILKIFREKEFGKLREGKYLELKEDNSINKIYIKARDLYDVAMINDERYKESYFDYYSYERVSKNALIAANQYLNEGLKYEIEDKEFLSDIYLLKFKVGYQLGEEKRYESLRKAGELSLVNQNILITALRQIPIECLKEKKANLIFLLDYLMKSIDNIQVGKESILYREIYNITRNEILEIAKNKKFKNTQLHKLLYIYDTISKKIQEVGIKEYEEIYIMHWNRFMDTLRENR